MQIRLSDHFTYSRLLRFTLPSVVTMIVASIYSVVDGLFVSNLVGAMALSAINIAFPVAMIIGAVGFMLGTGGSALVAKTLGEGKKELANQYFSMLIYSIIGIGAILTVIILIFVRPIMRLAGASDLLMESSVTYGTILIKFDHGSLMGVYKLVNDGQHLENEEDKYQFGETNIVYEKEYNDYDFIAEGDSSGIIGLYSCGLRGFENGAFGSYGGRYSYYTASGEDAGYLSTLSGGVVPGQYVNPETNNIEKYNPYLLDFQLEWAARADWCVNTYENCNHAPVVEMDEKDFTAAPGETVSFEAAVSDPDGDDCTSVWTTEPTGCVYSGKDETIYNWTVDGANGSFTIPEDTASGDCFCLTLKVQDNADAVMTRYAQVMVTVA